MEQGSPYIITLVGPESSGKSTLARLLANYFQCPLVPEYAREYLNLLGRPYEVSDLQIMAERQLEHIQYALESVKENISEIPKYFFPEGFRLKDVWQDFKERIPPEILSTLSETSILAFENKPFGPGECPIIVVDNGMLNFKIWSSIKYGVTIPVVEEALKSDVTSLYLLCRPVIPWMQDTLREAPTIVERAWIYNHFLKELSTNN